jgi:hypothetical protein
MRALPVIAAFGVAFAAAIIVGLTQGVHPFYADSEGYWLLSNSFTSSGHFSLLDFASPQRGYFFPLVIYALRLLSDGTFSSESTLVTIFIALCFALIGAVLVPRLAQIAWPEQSWGLPRRLMLMALLLIFWCGDVNYPLTDFPGLAMGLLALVAVARPNAPNWMLLGGMAAGAAFNMRPAYEALLPMLVVVVALNWWEERRTPHASMARRALCASMLILGFALVSLPQSLSAHRFFNTWSPVPGASTSLPGEVLTTGMSFQRQDSYERPIGTPNGVFYKDPSGQRLLNEQPEHKIKNSSQYVGLIASHPTVMIPLLVRHIVNGLDLRYNTVYVENRASGGRILLRISGFLVVFLALVRLLWPEARRKLGRVHWRYPVALASCVATSITSAVEARYMLPVEMLAYVLVLAPGWPSPIGPAGAGWTRYRGLAALTIAGLIYAAFLWHVVSGIKISIAYPV